MGGVGVPGEGGAGKADNVSSNAPANTPMNVECWENWGSNNDKRTHARFTLSADGKSASATVDWDGESNQYSGLTVRTKNETLPAMPEELGASDFPMIGLDFVDETNGFDFLVIEDPMQAIFAKTKVFMALHGYVNFKAKDPSDQNKVHEINDFNYFIRDFACVMR